MNTATPISDAKGHLERLRAKGADAAKIHHAERTVTMLQFRADRPPAPKPSTPSQGTVTNVERDVARVLGTDVARVAAKRFARKAEATRLSMLSTRPLELEIFTKMGIDPARLTDPRYVAKLAALRGRA